MPRFRLNHSLLRINLLEDRLTPAGLELWQDLPELPAVPDGAVAYIHPESSRTMTVRIDDLRSQLADVPTETEYLQGTSPLEFSIPTPSGGTQRFHVYDAPIMAPELAAAYPEIRTYQGQGIDDPAAKLRMDITPQGWHVQVLAPSGAWYIDPAFMGRDDVYTSYYRHDLSYDDVFPLQPGETRGALDEETIASRLSAFDGGCTCALCTGFNSETGEKPSTTNPLVGPTVKRTGTQLRTYRLAVAATGEYTAFHGGTVALGQAAIVTAMNRVNGVYESELAIRMVLVANNDLLVYTNASTDPYTNNSGGTMLSQNQTNVNAVIGSGNYDIGHVFSTGGGGVASLGSVGITSRKAQGVTGSPSPVNDAFTIDYVAHEMGHQFGANHIFNTSSDSNRNAGTAYEPGSGSTIMGYAGITGANSDLQPNSDPYFNHSSFDEIIRHVDVTIPAVGTRTATGNSVPTVNAGTDYIIPARTPFVLTASGTDANSTDVLTYSWEQRDLGPAILLTAADNGSSPLFRVRNPTTNPSRTFPRLSDLINNVNTNPLGERLPTTNWTSAAPMDFRVTVRDNRANGGGVNTDDMFVQVVDTGAAFAVTAPNTAVTWNGGTAQTVTWNIAGTTAAPINAANVNITLSTDGGFTYPITLATNTPNDGTQSITVPNVNTSTARVRVQGAGNIFFDISNANFTIVPIANNAPVITSNGGGASASINAVEDNPAVTTVTATDADVGAVLTYSISGGVDAGDFQINPTTGVLTFVNPPDFYNPVDSDGNNVYLVTVQVSDTIAVDTQALTVTVNAVNDAPQFTKGSDILVPLVGGTAPTYTFTGWATGINAGEPGESGQVLTFDVTNDNNGLFATQPSITSAGTLSFRPTDNTTGVANVTVILRDNGGTAFGGVNASQPQTFVISVGVNVAPSLNNAGSPELAPVGKDATSPFGTSVLAFASSAITDANVGDPKGIAVVGMTEQANGQWQYTIDNGGTWNDLETASLTSARLLREQDRVRYVPNVGVVDILPTLTFHAWDQSTGTFGGSANLTTTGGSTAFSSASESVMGRVIPLLISINEDQRTTGTVLKTFIAANGFADPDALAKRGMAFVASGGEIPGSFEISTNGRTWTKLTDLTTTSARLVRETDRVRFVPSPNFSGDVYLKYHAWDQSTGTTMGLASVAGNTGVANPFSVGSDYFAIRVKPINDRPVIDRLAATNLTPVASNATDPAGDTVASILGTTVTDMDPGTIPGIAVTARSRVGGKWQYQVDGQTTWADFIAPTSARAVLLNPLDRVRFLPDATGTYVGKPTISFKAWDRSTPLASGSVANSATTAFSSAVETGVISVSASPVTPTNTAPTLDNSGTPALIGVLEDARTAVGDAVSTLLSGAVTDPDASALRGIAITGATGTTTGRWQYSLNGRSWITLNANIGEGFALLLKDSQLVRYLPNANWNGTATLSYHAWDQTRGTPGAYANLTLVGSTGGSSPFSTAIESASITVAPVNDAPVLNTKPAPVFTRLAIDQTNSTGNTVAQIIGSAISDVDAGAVQGIAVTRASDLNGTWEFSTNNGSTWTDIGTDLSTANARFLRPQDRLRFVPAVGYIGTQSISFKAWDQTTDSFGSLGTTLGKTSVSTAIESATILVSFENFKPVLDTKPDVRMTPVLVNATNPTGTLVSSLLGSAVVDADPGAVTGIAITSATTTTGTWEYSLNGGSTWLPIVFVSNNDSRCLRSTDLIRFVPKTGFAGTVKLGYKAWDQLSAGTQPAILVPTNTSDFSAATEFATLAVNQAPTLV